MFRRRFQLEKEQKGMFREIAQDTEVFFFFNCGKMSVKQRFYFNHF